MKPSIIIGIDPGFADMGYGVVAIDRFGERCLAYGSVKTSPDAPIAARLAQVHRELGALIERYAPDRIAIERLYFSKNAKTAMLVAEARGVIRLCIEQRNVPCIEFDPGAVKLAVCGQGNADKRQVQKMVRALLRLDEIPKPDDAADALALALAAAFHADLRAASRAR